MAQAHSDLKVAVQSATSPCQIMEILQYSCEQELSAQGTGFHTHCYPIPRIFRMCKGRPAVEITKFVKVDEQTGAVEIPSESSLQLPKGRPWRDVYRYPSEDTDQQAGNSPSISKPS